MALTESLIKDTYDKLKKRASLYLEDGNVKKALLYTHLAAYTNSCFFLTFHDQELEDIVIKVGKSISKSDVYIPNSNKVVMFDSLSRYRGGLTVQYINAIIEAGWELLYITEQEINAPQRKELKAFLESKNNLTILEIPTNLKGMNKLQYTYDKIIQFSPSRLYIHQNSYDAFFSTLSYALPASVEKYTIDIADHAFLLGFNACDYSFEFRTLGCSYAYKYRQQPIDRMFMLPFYPVIDNVPFKGLPDCCKGKKIILSGGRYFKIIDAEDTFFKLVQKITNLHPDVVVLFPGSGDDIVIKQKIKKYALSDKLILLGWRDDMSELFRRADIFLNTYPHGGGTMSQYAAHLKTPILSYMPIGGCSNPIECFVCQDGTMNISSVGESDFIIETDRLLRDIKYAKLKAERTYDCVLGIDKFNNYFKQMSEDKKNIIPFEIDKKVMMNNDFLQKQLDYYNKTGEFQMRLVAFIGVNSITWRKDFLLPFIKRIFPKLFKVISTRGVHFNRV